MTSDQEPKDALISVLCAYATAKSSQETPSCDEMAQSCGQNASRGIRLQSDDP
jgi:hypothetical protein